MYMYCCIKCFEDSVIKDKIKSQENTGDCDYCGENDVPIIEIQELVGDFECFLSIYGITTHGEHYNYHLQCPTNHGELLADLIQEDWDLFSYNTSYTELLFDILNYNRGYEDSLDRSDLYSRDNTSFTYVSSKDIWSEFTYSIKRKNRFFPENGLFDELKTLLPNKSIVINQNISFFRARIGQFEIKDMGPPPFDKATSGRVNPRGIPYLYVADDKYTCIAETRPWIGAKVTIVNINSLTSLNFIDLSSKEFMRSPFLSKNLSESIQAQELLNHLAYELSKPIDPSVSDIEYIPTQYLAELIKNLGYDGLKYKSSLGTGANYVFFNPENVRYISTEICEISTVGYDYNFYQT